MLVIAFEIFAHIFFAGIAIFIGLVLVSAHVK